MVTSLLRWLRLMVYHRLILQRLLLFEVRCPLCVFIDRPIYRGERLAGYPKKREAPCEVCSSWSEL